MGNNVRPLEQKLSGDAAGETNGKAKPSADKPTKPLGKVVSSDGTKTAR